MFVNEISNTSFNNSRLSISSILDCQLLEPDANTGPNRNSHNSLNLASKFSFVKN